MSEAQIIELQTKLAYQEDLVQSLNDLVIEQQNRIDKLEAICRQLIEQYKRTEAQQGDNQPAEHEIPPHY